MTGVAAFLGSDETICDAIDKSGEDFLECQGAGRWMMNLYNSLAYKSTCHFENHNEQSTMTRTATHIL